MVAQLPDAVQNLRLVIDAMEGNLPRADGIANRIRELRVGYENRIAQLEGRIAALENRVEPAQPPRSLLKEGIRFLVVKILCPLTMIGLSIAVYDHFAPRLTPEAQRALPRYCSLNPDPFLCPRQFLQRYSGCTSEDVETGKCKQRPFPV